MFEHYREKIAGTNLDPRSLLSTDYFNHFNSVIMLYGMLPDMPDLLEEIDAWEFLDYVGHFKASGLDFADLAIEAYPHAPAPLRTAFETKILDMKAFVETSRVRLREIMGLGDPARFASESIKASRDLQRMVDEGGAIVHGQEASLDQSAIDKMF